MEFQRVLKKATIFLLQDFSARSSEGQMSYPLSPFHAALVRGNKSFVQDVLGHLTPMQIGIALNSTIRYEHEDEVGGYPQIFNSIRSKLDDEEWRVLSGVRRNADCDELRTMLKLCCHCSPRQRVQEFHLPLAMAAASQNIELFELLLTSGSDVLARDNNGNSIVHNLVFISDSKPAVAVEMLASLERITPASQRRHVMKTENKDGLSPLDVATDRGLPEMMLAIMNVEGAYRYTVGQCGIYKHYLYDVSEYESAVATKCSLFHYLVEINETQLFRFDRCGFFTREPFRSWIQTTIKNKYWQMTRWETMWIAYITMIFVDLFATRNGNDNLVWLIRPWLLFLSIATILKEIVIFAMTRSRVIQSLRWRVRGHVPVSMSGVFRVSHLLLAAMVIWSKPFLRHQSSDFYHFKEHISSIFTTFFSIASILYFFQMQLSGGYILIILGKVVYNTFTFFYICSVIYIGFCVSFFFIRVAPPGANACTSSAKNTTMFSETFYESFLFLSLVQAPADIYFESWANPFHAVAHYIAGVIIIGIVMTNLLIALMTKRVQDIYDHRVSLLMIEKLSIVRDLENMSNIFFWPSFMQSFWKRYFWKRQRGREFRHDALCTMAYLELVENVTEQTYTTF